MNGLPIVICGVTLVKLRTSAHVSDKIQETAQVARDQWRSALCEADEDLDTRHGEAVCALISLHVERLEGGRRFKATRRSDSHRPEFCSPLYKEYRKSSWQSAFLISFGSQYVPPCLDVEEFACRCNR